MSDSESIFNPIDDSLSERVRAYHRVCRAFILVHRSSLSLDSNHLNSHIGDAIETKEAMKSIKFSFDKAKKSVSKKDVSQALKEGIISNGQNSEIIQADREYELAIKRASSSSFNNSQFSR